MKKHIQRCGTKEGGKQKEEAEQKEATKFLFYENLAGSVEIPELPLDLPITCFAQLIHRFDGLEPGANANSARGFGIGYPTSISSKARNEEDPSLVQIPHLTIEVSEVIKNELGSFIYAEESSKPVAATSSAGVVAALSATLGDFAVAAGLPTVLGTNVGGLDAKIPVGGFVPPKPGVSDLVLDLDTLAITVGASDNLPAAKLAILPCANLEDLKVLWTVMLQL
ncbi:hypothetical protein SUGI_1035250 [Cryptomeria japonica]|nr:hypothetical protein SUGI_1035250 [Cryptomeria japonica]